MDHVLAAATLSVLTVNILGLAYRWLEARQLRLRLRDLYLFDEGRHGLPAGSRIVTVGTSVLVEIGGAASKDEA